jgi:hypothetical protein
MVLKAFIRPTIVLGSPTTESISNQGLCGLLLNFRLLFVLQSLHEAEPMIVVTNNGGLG